MSVAPDVPQVDLVAAAVLAVPGVTRLHAGPWGEVATYLPGRRVAGVRNVRTVRTVDGVDDEALEIHVAVSDEATCLQTAAAVRAAVSTVVRSRVDVVVEDLDPVVRQDLR